MGASATCWRTHLCDGSYLPFTSATTSQRQPAVKLHRVFASPWESPDSALECTVHRAQRWDSDALVNPFMQAATEAARYYAHAVTFSSLGTDPVRGGSARTDLSTSPWRSDRLFTRNRVFGVRSLRILDTSGLLSRSSSKRGERYGLIPVS